MWWHNPVTDIDKLSLSAYKLQIQTIRTLPPWCATALRTVKNREILRSAESLTWPKFEVPQIVANMICLRKWNFPCT